MQQAPVPAEQPMLSPAGGQLPLQPASPQHSSSRAAPASRPGLCSTVPGTEIGRSREEAGTAGIFVAHEQAARCLTHDAAASRPGQQEGEHDVGGNSLEAAHTAIAGPAEQPEEAQSEGGGSCLEPACTAYAGCADQWEEARGSGGSNGCLEAARTAVASAAEQPEDAGGSGSGSSCPEAACTASSRIADQQEEAQRSGGGSSCSEAVRAAFGAWHEATVLEWRRRECAVGPLLHRRQRRCHALRSVMMDWK
jgi:hypothetical protein